MAFYFAFCTIHIHETPESLDWVITNMSVILSPTSVFYLNWEIFKVSILNQLQTACGISKTSGCEKIQMVSPLDEKHIEQIFFSFNFSSSPLESISKKLPCFSPSFCLKWYACSEVCLFSS